MFRFDIANADRIIVRLERLERMDGLDDAMEDAAQAVVVDARIYPPERPGQRYVRTERLKMGWARTPVRHQGRELSIGIANPTDYLGDVMGTATQLAPFRGRWRTIRRVADDNRVKVRATLHAAVLRLWRGAR